MKTRFHWLVRLLPVILAGKSIVLCMCSGKYIDIYFIMKITYPISTLPEHLHNTFPSYAKIPENTLTEKKKFLFPL